jgi:O-antigen ligase
MWTPGAIPVSKERVSIIVLLAFLGFYIFSLIDVSGLMTKLVKYDKIPVQPIAFGAAAFLIIPWRRGKKFPIYFVGAWTYWVLFSIGGCLGTKRELGLGDYELIQLVIKLWISLVGVPLLATRTIVRDKYSMFIKLTVIVLAIGGAFAVVQVIRPEMFTAWMHEKGRGAGFWVNPNSCAEICVFGLFLSTICNFKSKFFANGLRLLLLGGIMASMSRGGLSMLFVGAVAYAVASKQWKILARVGLGFVLVVVMGLALAVIAKQAGMASLSRVERFASFTTGDVGSSGSDRLSLWGYGWRGVMEDPILGRGHRAMEKIVQIGSGFGPHNYYLYVWGNSGLMGLLGYLFFLVSLLRMGLRCKQVQNRAMVIAMTGIIAVTSLVSHSFMNSVYFGPIFAVMLLTSYYDLPVGKPAPAPIPNRQPVIGPQQRRRPAF